MGHHMKLILSKCIKLLKSNPSKVLVCQCIDGVLLISFFVMESSLIFGSHEETNAYNITILSFAELVESEDSHSPFTSNESGLNSGSSSIHSSLETNGNSCTMVSGQISPESHDSLLFFNNCDSAGKEDDTQNTESSGIESAEQSLSNENNLTQHQLEDLAILDALIENPLATNACQINDVIELLSPPSHNSATKSLLDNICLETQVPETIRDTSSLNYLDTPLVSGNSALGDHQPTQLDSNALISHSNVMPTQNIPRSNAQQSESRMVGVLICVDVPPLTNKQRYILPGPPIPKTIAISGKERILHRLNPHKLDEAKAKVAVLPVGELTHGKEYGDNHLMILVSKPHKNLLELVYALVERMKLIPGALEADNSEGESALYIASVSLPEEPVVARYIAETLLDMDVNIAELTYEDGKSLTHCVSERGDSHRNVLAELLSLKDPDTGNHVFNLKKPSDRNGHTLLHVAACSHGKDNVCCIATVRLLVKQGANLLEQEWRAGFSVLHIAVREACDPPLVLTILEEAQNTTGGTEVAVNQVTYNGDTPLHLVAVNDHVCVEKQCEAFRLLIYHGAHRGKRNHGGKVALALVSKSRKEQIRRALPRR